MLNSHFGVYWHDYCSQATSSTMYVFPEGAKLLGPNVFPLNVPDAYV